MDILIIILALICAYVVFVSITYILARLLFPKIEISDLEFGGKSKRNRSRNVRRFSSRAFR